MFLFNNTSARDLVCYLSRKIPRNKGNYVCLSDSSMATNVQSIIKVHKEIRKTKEQRKKQTLHVKNICKKQMAHCQGLKDRQKDPHTLDFMKEPLQQVHHRA
jgi:hypothetical protein